jgi:hypothetical protein
MINLSCKEDVSSFSRLLAMKASLSRIRGNHFAWDGVFWKLSLFRS